jgi:class 3 adenylate cyclase
MHGSFRIPFWSCWVGTQFWMCGRAILFADICGFTPLIEAMPPEQVMGFVNGFLSRMELPVREGAGFIDNIVDDAVMAVFDKGAEAGVVAGIAMQRALQDWQDRAGLSVQLA